jgi:hypothetical protein
MSDPVDVPETVHDQIEAIRQSGTHNMATLIDRAVQEYDFERLSEWYDDHRDDYFRATVGGAGWNIVDDDEYDE